MVSGADTPGHPWKRPPRAGHRKHQPTLSRPRPLARRRQVLLALWEGQLAAVAAVRAGSARDRIAVAAEAALPLLGARRPAGLCRRRHVGAHRRAGRRRTAAHLRLARGPACPADGRRRGGLDRLHRERRGRSPPPRGATSRAHAIGRDDVVHRHRRQRLARPSPSPPCAKPPRRGALTIGIANSPGGAAARRGRAPDPGRDRRRSRSPARRA